MRILLTHPNRLAVLTLMISFVVLINKNCSYARNSCRMDIALTTTNASLPMDLMNCARIIRRIASIKQRTALCSFEKDAAIMEKDAISNIEENNSSTKLKKEQFKAILERCLLRSESNLA